MKETVGLAKTLLRREALQASTSGCCGQPSSCGHLPLTLVESRFKCLSMGRGSLYQAGIIIRSLVVFPAPQPMSPPSLLCRAGMNRKREALSGLCSPTPVAAEFQITPQTKPKQAGSCVPLSPLSLALVTRLGSSAALLWLVTC